ncbi:hypothetical protein GALL_221540 [mine drainage metagenome]|uniref:Uncharacterized protein n=1 Tax=mine drainage metagenome TaxID=410659 RepID=A0A1J5RUQ3_9ZZZZ
MIRQSKNWALPILLLLAMQASAEGPAVDGVNGKITAQGGRSGGSDGSLLDGVITFPIAQSWGAQLDGGGGRLGHSSLSSVGGHLFWRDPDSGLLGLTASHHSSGGATAQRVGIEAEGYLSDFTLSARAGYQRRTLDTPIGSATDNKTYTRLRGSWYATENLAISARLQHVDSTRSALEVEWQPGINGMAGLSAIASYGRDASSKTNTTVIGVRYYLDREKSLIKRHRTGDPDSSTEFNSYWGGGSCTVDGMSGYWVQVGNQGSCVVPPPYPW